MKKDRNLDALINETDNATVAENKPKKSKKEKNGSFKDGVKKFTGSKKFKFGTISSGIIAAVIAIVVLVNFVFGLLSERFGWEIDLTSAKLFELTDESVEYLKKLETPVTITVLVDETELPDFYLKLFDNYTVYGKNVTLNYINPDNNPGYFTDLGIDDLTVYDYILIYCPETKKYRTVMHNAYTYESDLIDFENYTSIAEESISSGIAYVVSKETHKAYFIEGHGESYSTSVTQMFSYNGFEVENINLLAVDKFDEDANLMVINTPTSDFTSAELDKIDEFLNNNGNLGRNLILIEGNGSPTLPLLNQYAQEWGIDIRSEKVIDTTNVGQWSLGSYVMLGNYGDTSLAAKQIAKKVIPVMQLGEPKPLNKLFESSSEIESVKEILTSYDEAYTKSSDTILSNDNLEKAQGDAAGPFNLALLSTKTQYNSNNEQVYGKFLVVGTSAFTADTFIGTSSIGNAGYFINVFQDMCNISSENALNITPKSIAAPTLTFLEGGAGTFLIILVMVVIPVILIIIGMLIWLRRRHL